MAQPKQPPQQPQPWPRRVRFPGEPEDSDEFYTRIAKEQSALNAAKPKRESAVEGLNAYYSSTREAEQLVAKARTEQVAAGPYAWNGSGMIAPPGDPLVARQKWAQINPGTPFPGDESK